MIKYFIYLLLAILVYVEANPTDILKNHVANLQTKRGLFENNVLISKRNSPTPNRLPVLRVDESWNNVGGQKGPTGRTDPAVEYIGKHLVVFGGAIEAYNIFDPEQFIFGGIQFKNDTWKFNVKTEIWEEIQVDVSPSPRGFFQYASINENDNRQMFVYGGVTYFGSLAFLFANLLSDFWRFDAIDNTWHEIVASNVGPGPRLQGRAAVIDGEFYLFGGINYLDVLSDPQANLTNDLWKFNFNSNSWTLLSANGASDSPAKRSNFAMSAVQIKVYINSHKFVYKSALLVYGGEDPFAVPPNPSTFGDTWIWWIDDEYWEEITPVPEKDIFPIRNDAASAAYHNFVFIIFGDIPGGTGGNPLTENITECFAPFVQSPDNAAWVGELEKRQGEVKFAWRKFSGHINPQRIKTGTASIAKNEYNDIRLYYFGGWDFICQEFEENGQLFRVGPGQVWNDNTLFFDISSVIKKLQYHFDNDEDEDD